MLGPLAGRDVVLFDADGGRRARQLLAAGARLVAIAAPDELAGLRRVLRAEIGDGRASLVAGTTVASGLPAGSADVAVSFWSAFRGGTAEELAEAERILRADGRLLVVHEYARDDVARLRHADLAKDAIAWSRRDGWFMEQGFKVRVIHAFWTFPDVETMRAFCADLLGSGVAEADVLAAARRPRLAWKVVVYHRDRAAADEAPDTTVS